LDVTEASKVLATPEAVAIPTLTTPGRGIRARIHGAARLDSRPFSRRTISTYR
jgi:hypothetical protein